MENILFNTNKNHSTNQIDVYNTERAFAARSSSNVPSYGLTLEPSVLVIPYDGTLNRRRQLLFRYYIHLSGLCYDV